VSRYRQLEFLADSPAPTDQQLTAIERQLGAKLPQDFKAFLRVANGVYLDYSIEVPTPSGPEWFCFCNTFSTFGDGDDTFLGELAALRRLRDLPPRVLPFARADGGMEYLLLDLRDESTGRVIASLSEDSPLVPVASSFSEYIERLEPDI
jgi:cell wall assembly regulator SMI1